MKKYIFNLIFVLTSFTGFSQIDLNQNLNVSDTLIEVNAKFPGGQTALLKYLANSIEYPNEAKLNKEEGKVVLRFIINRNGETEDIIILESVSKSIDEEAIRVVRNMPKWTPGSHHGNLVKQYFFLPINFSLPSKKKSEEKRDIRKNGFIIQLPEFE